MAETTLIPFSTLPACASSCGPLYDVNGACVPPAAATATATVYESCFCADARLTAFSTATAGVCDAACTATPADYGSITAWYQSLCSSVQALDADATTTTDASGATVVSSSSSKNSGGGGWISTHYQWVIFIVIMVVGITGIWIGAAIWRRHYLRKKDRQYALGKNLAQRTGSGQNPYVGSPTNRSGSVRGAAGGGGSFMPGSGAEPFAEKPKKKFFGRS